MEALKAIGVEAGQGRRYEEAFYSLALVYTALYNKVEKYLGEYDVTPAKLNVLMIIKHQGREKGLNQREIGMRLMVSPSNMTRLLERLEREKLIERTGQTGDKRVNVVRISNRGSKILDQIWPGYMRLMKGSMGRISLLEQKALSETLLKLFQRLTA